MEPIITTIVTRDTSAILDLLTSFFIAKLSESEKGQVAHFISDCADEANAQGLIVQAKLFRFAEILWGGAAIGTEEMAEDCANKTLSLIAGYHEQKKVNGHRASISPEWQRLAASKGQSTVTVEAPAAPAAAVEVPAAPTAAVEVPAAPAAVEVPTAVAAPGVEPAEAAPAPEPEVRRRPQKQAATKRARKQKPA
jgi:hypothetical protein